MKNIVKFSTLTLVVGLFLSGSAQAAGGMSTSATPSYDGVSDKKRKVKKTGSSRKRAPKPISVQGPPSMQIYGTVDEQQIIINFYFFAPFEQAINGSLIDGSVKVTPFQKDGSPASAFISPRDQKIAESIIAELKVDYASFSSKPASSRSSALGTIVLNKKANWSEADFALAQKLVLELFAPVKFNVWQNVYNAKPMATPGDFATDAPKAGN